MPLLPLPDINSISGLAPYTQYKSNDEVVNLFKTIKTFLYNKVIEKTDLLEQTKWSFEGKNEYLQFYYENLFGFYRSFGETKVNNLYDDGILYESDKIYDYTTFTGFLDLDYYKILIKYFFDYKDECYTKGWLYSLALEFCSLTPDKVSIKDEFDKVIVKIPRRTQSVLLERIFLNKQTYNNVPICDIVFILTTD